MTYALALDMGGTHIGCGLVEGRRLLGSAEDSVLRALKASGICFQRSPLNYSSCWIRPMSRRANVRALP